MTLASLASSIEITLKGVAYFQVALRFSSVGGKQLTKYLPGFILGRCGANSVTPGAAAHHSHLIMLARRRARTVSSQQHDLIHGLCDNNSTAVFPLKIERALQGRNETYRCITCFKSISVLNVSCYSTTTCTFYQSYAAMTSGVRAETFDGPVLRAHAWFPFSHKISQFISCNSSP